MFGLLQDFLQDHRPLCRKAEKPLTGSEVQAREEQNKNFRCDLGKWLSGHVRNVKLKGHVSQWVLQVLIKRVNYRQILSFPDKTIFRLASPPVELSASRKKPLDIAHVCALARQLPSRLDLVHFNAELSISFCTDFFFFF